MVKKWKTKKKGRYNYLDIKYKYVQDKIIEKKKKIKIKLILIGSHSGMTNLLTKKYFCTQAQILGRLIKKM